MTFHSLCVLNTCLSLRDCIWRPEDRNVCRVSLSTLFLEMAYDIGPGNSQFSKLVDCRKHQRLTLSVTHLLKDRITSVHSHDQAFVFLLESFKHLDVTVLRNLYMSTLHLHQNHPPKTPVKFSWVTSPTFSKINDLFYN